jgi:predicted Zn finger-like uncharacterized protein
MAVIVCPGCETRVQISDDARGRRVRCPACGEVFRADENLSEGIQTAAAAGAVAPARAATPPAPSSKAAEPEFVETEAAERPSEQPSGGPTERWATYAYTIRQPLPARLPNGRLATVLMLLLVPCAFASAAALFHFVDVLMGLQASRRGVFSFPTHAERMVSILGIWFLLHGSATIVFWIWNYRAYANLYLLSVDNLRYSPGWALTSWLLPYANFVVPFLVPGVVEGE